MPRIAVTGHMNLTAQTTDLVRAALRDRLSHLAPDGAGLTGLSCLAEGADALFAAAVLDAGGTLCAVLPAADYRRDKVSPHYAPEFDRLIAVWDGQGAVDRGGTAAVVADAHTRGLPVDIVWPPGAQRRP